MPTVDRKSLLQILDTKLSAEEVATLIFDLALDQANLEGTIKRARLRSLIDYYERRGQMERLLAAVVALRPDVLAPDTVYAAPAIEPPLPRWHPPNWRRWLLAGLVIALALAATVVGAQWYQTQSSNNAPTLASLTRLIEQDPNNAVAYFNRGEFLRDRGNYDRAIPDYTHAIKLQPRYGTAYERLGLSYEAIGDYGRALENYTQAIEYQPNERAFHYRGSLYAKQGDPDSAIRDLSESISRKSDFSPAYYTRGLAYRQQKENVKAIADFQTVLDLDNDSYIRGEAEKQLKSLKTP